MQSIMDWISNLAVQLIDAIGLYGIFIGMVLESACIPIPSEVILLSGGLAAANGTISWQEVVIAGVLGNVLGSIIAYQIGALGGRKILNKYGKYVFFRSSHLDQAEKWFTRYGAMSVFFTRNLPFIRTFISLPAGIAKMKFSTFLLYTFLGCIPWNIALAYAGFKWGANADVLERYMHPISYAVAIVVVGLFAYWLLIRKRTRV
ncbi:alkaline phosphatase [Paenibacillus glycanilyticus]|uniref:Alkaline phosphatase n=1 Tax=Paenibacillus glycanilyticus TaxID=126569 RepID=A0ABQ6NFT5_9BACL|nr:DedA family protein [Paenibacillus glycanilyticus]GMK42884.1 alkaline phosphatase [Paenibacillus glycanilyticus]